MSRKKILFATDYSEASEAALRIASELARVEDALLLIVHVSTEAPYPVGELFEDGPEEDPEELKKLHAVRPKDPEVVCEHRLLHGEPSAEPVKPGRVIVEFAKKEGIDKIVIGTHGMAGLGSLLTGSVTEYVLRHAPCVVVAVKTTGTLKA